MKMPALMIDCSYGNAKLSLSAVPPWNGIPGICLIHVIWFKPLILPWPASPSWYLPQICGLSLPLLLLIHSKNDLLTQISSKSISCWAQLACSKTTRKTTFQSRLRIAAQETEPTCERDEFKSKFAVQALSCATCPSDNIYFKVIQSFQSTLKPFEVIQSNFEIKLLPVQQASVWCLVLSYFYWKRDCWAPFSLPSFTA